MFTAFFCYPMLSEINMPMLSYSTVFEYLQRARSESAGTEACSRETICHGFSGRCCRRSLAKQIESSSDIDCLYEALRGRLV